MAEDTSIRQWLLWGIIVVVLAVVVGTAVWTRQGGRTRQGSSNEKPLEGLKNFGTVPDFSLIERSGRQVSLAELKGKFWIANFIYTHCPDTCPIQTAQMKELQAEFKDQQKLRLVSITVDPERDSTAVLSKYARRFEADPERWLFLTGEKKSIHRLAQEGFLLGAAEIPKAKRPASGATHTHSPRFVLIDPKAQIRGYYTSTDMEAMTRLRRDLKVLLRNSE